MQSSRLKPNVFQKIFQKGKLTPRIVITVQVMAVPGVSPRYPHPINPVTEGRQYKLGAHPSRTGHPDNPEIRWVLEPAHTSQVCRTITTPVTQKCRNLWLPVIHSYLLMFIHPQKTTEYRIQALSKILPRGQGRGLVDKPALGSHCDHTALHHKKHTTELPHISFIMAMI